MFWFEQPPAHWPEEDKAYINRLMQYIDQGINSVNGVIVRDTVPEQPREGRIYYLREDLSDGATEGYYVYLDDVWRKIAFEDLP